MNRNLLAVVLLLGACGVGNPPSFPPSNRPPQQLPQDPTVPPPSGIVRQAQLVSYPACGSLDSAVKAKLMGEMQAALGQSLKTALEYYRHGYYWWGGGADAGVSGSGGAGGTSGGGGAGGGPAAAPTNVTGTNVQVAGVDEPDLIKNDGTRIFVLSKGKLFAS